MARDYYKILIVSQSGKGKTYSFRNLNPDSTGFLNVEDKPLPFRNKFKYHIRPNDMMSIKIGLKSLADNPEVTVIVIDSLSAVFDKILKIAKATKKGFDIWNNYNEEISNFLDYVKSIEKEVILTAHYEWIQDEGGAKERRVKVQGKALEGVLEKDFTIVLYADRKMDSNTKKVEAWFDLALDNSSSKCPPAIFGEGVYKIDNDCALLIEAIENFTK